MQTYLVGGAVRDELLGLDVKDRDWVVVGATLEQMRAQGFRQVGADFPVFLHPRTQEEYALARTERKQGRGYHGFTVYSAPDVTLEQDLQRRDLTINAMARAENGELIDPFHGLDDLKARRLRHVSPAFAEDPLRILRTARFAARFQPLGFSVCEDTLTLMRRMVDDGEVAHLVPERVWQEIQRALHEAAPTVFFQVLAECGALAVLIPELNEPDRLATGLNALDCLALRPDTSTGQRFAGLFAAVPTDQAEHRARCLKAPNDCRDMARLTSHFLDRLTALSLPEGPAPALLELLDTADVWRRRPRFDALLTVLHCATPPGLAGRVRQLELAAQVATGVEPAALLAQGYRGSALGQAIHQERLKRIEGALSAHNHRGSP